jgi:hypothetical protein
VIIIKEKHISIDEGIINMKIEQNKWIENEGWINGFSQALSESAQLVLMFGARSALSNPQLTDKVRIAYPAAHLIGCSTAGEIYNTQVLDNSLIITAVELENSYVKGVSIKMDQVQNSFEAGECLSKMIDPAELVHLFVLSDGLLVNGSELVRGLTSNLPENITVTGGLAGDGVDFSQTLVTCEGKTESNSIAAIGFYGKKLKVGFASMGGWDSFGTERLVTRSKENVLYELDGYSALELYKKYLGEHAKGLPATGLLFPLSLRTKSGETGVVRTILSINEDEQSMTFAGDIPEGSYVRLMKANFDRLIDGAIGAAKGSYQSISSSSPDLAILISCVGRKIVLKQRIEEEVEGVRDVLGPQTVLTGFYSYGEISPFNSGAKCELHNQTMTITTFKEE